MDEKILTVVVPCYNSQDYMKHCIKTLLNEREGLEIKQQVGRKRCRCERCRKGEEEFLSAHVCLGSCSLLSIGEEC